MSRTSLRQRGAGSATASGGLARGIAARPGLLYLLLGLTAAFAATAAGAGTIDPRDGAGSEALALELVAGGLERPLGLAHAGDGSGRLFVVLQDGRVLIHDGGGLLAEPFLDLSSRVSCCGERGLLGLAFHPDYAANGLFYVSYTAGNGDSVISRLSVSGDPDRADAGSEEELLRFAQPFGNHNGGHLAFGPDGFLYVASGDGGSGGDPQNNGQSLDTLLGKLLRIDVDGGFPYAVPPDNPFTGVAGARGEIWAYGLRNPWRFSFDRATGDLYVADVGQARREEVDFEPAGGDGGRNYGWRRMEGSACFDPATGCDDGTLTLPVVDYTHALGCSVTGGYRYRGPAAPTLPRFYVFGDFCSGRVWGARPNAAGAWLATQLLESGLTLSSFGEDEAGRLYAVHYAAGDGAVYRLLGRALFASGFDGGDATDWSRTRGAVRVVTPGLAGSSHALEVTVDGSRARSFVESRRPDREPTLLVRFDLKVQRVDLGGGEVEILRLGAARRHLRLLLGRQGGRYRVRLLARDGGGFREVGSTRVPANRRVRLAVEWSRATGPAAEDGQARLLKAGRVRAEVTDLAGAGQAIQWVRLGLPAGSRGAAAGTGGAFLVDGFEITP